LEVKTELDCGNVVIKLYEVSFRRKCNRNITCENKQGKMIWQVEDIDLSSDTPFINISSFDQEKIIAYNWIGLEWIITLTFKQEN